MPDDDLRGDIESALGGGGDDAGDASPPAAPSDTSQADPGASGGPAVPADDSAVPSAAAPVADRDSLGRFLPKKEGTAPAPTAGQPTPSVPAGALVTPTPAAAPTPEIPPPAGWGPAVREHWAATPLPVREQIAQREQQMQQWANSTAPARNTGQAFMQAIEPHRMTIQAEGVDPITAVVNLMQVGTTLRFGTPQEKAQQIARISQIYSVDLQLLDAALAGAAPPQNPQNTQATIQAELQRSLAPFYQLAQQRQQAEEQQSYEQNRNELVSFASDPKHEFIDDVRMLMADMIDVAAKQKYVMPLQDAYDRACLLHPEVSKIIMARQRGANAQQLTAAAQRAKAAAVSVKGLAPVGNPSGSEPSSLRDSVEAAIEHHSRV